VPYNNRGVALAYLDENQQAIAAFNQALSINSKYAEAYYNRGTVYQELGQQQTAMEDYNQAIALNPQHAEAYYNRGLLRYDLKDQQGAIKDIQRAKDLFVKQGNLEFYQQAVRKLKEISRK
jgi:tetratricopeptide (TPR) repeat protein